MEVIAIGATGGSGTRVVARLLKRMGIYMGSNLNESEDNRVMERFINHWANRYELSEKYPLCGEELYVMDLEFNEFVHVMESSSFALKDKIGKNIWGFKNPPNIFLIKYIHERFPEIKFIHVVRDGRDMAFSENQNQVRRFGRVVIPEYMSERAEIKSAALWNRINLRAKRYADNNMSGKYIFIKYEDLCKDLSGTIKKISSFCGMKADLCDLASQVQPPDTIRRYLKEDRGLVEQITEICKEGLMEFGYIKR